MSKFFLLLFLWFCTAGPLLGQPGGMAGPMSCNIEARVLRLIKTHDTHPKSPCAKHPCIARVRIISVSGCGASVSKALNEGNIVYINFAYTLCNTTKIFPAMQAKYPGLKKGDTFRAALTQHPKMGGGSLLIVYDYRKL